MKPETRNLLSGLIVGTLVAVAFSFGGFLFLQGQHTDFGVAMFIAVPFVSGFAVGAIVRRAQRIAACCICGGFITLALLVLLGWEGVVCCIMALPIVAAGMTIGAVAGYWMIGRSLDAVPPVQRVSALLLLPLLLPIAEQAEKPSRVERTETFTTECFINAPPQRTWHNLAAMDELSGPRPFLLRIGLPVPQRCELNGARVGGQRVCLFDSGRIVQEITDWRPPAHMGTRVVGVTLPGRRWLTYHTASYELYAVRNGTRVVRHTTIGSRLYPRWYWRPLEAWGVTSEHEYVFANLQRHAEAP